MLTFSGQPGNSQWAIGYTAALIYAVGAVPFKDDFWTTSSQPNCHYALAGGCNEPNPVLQVRKNPLLLHVHTYALGHAKRKTICAMCVCVPFSPSEHLCDTVILIPS